MVGGDITKARWGKQLEMFTCFLVSAAIHQMDEDFLYKLQLFMFQVIHASLNHHRGGRGVLGCSLQRCAGL